MGSNRGPALRVHGTILADWISIFIQDVCVEKLAKLSCGSILLSILVLSGAGRSAEIGIEWAAVCEHCHLQIGIFAVAVCGCIDRNSIEECSRSITVRSKLGLRDVAITSGHNNLELITILTRVIRVARCYGSSPEHAFDLSCAAWLST